MLSVWVAVLEASAVEMSAFSPIKWDRVALGSVWFNLSTSDKLNHTVSVSEELLTRTTLLP